MPDSPRSTELPAPVDVLGLPLCPLRAAELIDLLVARAAQGVRTSVAYANAHTANLACRDGRFRALLAGADLLYADGASMVWASRWSRRRLPERITAADHFGRFARSCAQAGVAIYLLGGRPGVADRAARRLLTEIPNLRVAGTHHGHFDAADSARLVAEINATGAGVLCIGLSSPRQERWLAEQGEALKVPVRWCVGALFDYLAGVERRAPSWLCRMGGEWLFRLLVDPAGKWRRYVVGNPLFIVNALRWRARSAGAGQSGGAPALVRT